MCSSATHNSSGCEGIQELIAWYPSQALDEDEKRRVEAHIAGCPVCADLLQFTSDIKGLLLEKLNPHPEADVLVSFVEDKTAMDPQQRSIIEGHLNICPECKEQAAMLEAVERNSSVEETTTPSIPHTQEMTPHAQEMAAGLIARLRDFWNSMRTGLFKPVPAAIYLIVALLAVGLHLLQPGGWMGGIFGQKTELPSGTSPVSGVLGGVVILPDETDRVRQLSLEKTGIPQIDVRKPQFLLLELTSLEAPPPAEDMYTVELFKESSTEPVFVETARGQTFRENYTICFPLEAGVLLPGNYVVRVVSPGGDTIFCSSLSAR